MNSHFYDLAPDVQVLGVEESQLNMGIVGKKEASLILIDTLPSNIFVRHLDQIYKRGKPLIIIHNHCHVDHCEGDSLLGEAEVVLFESQMKMLSIEKKHFPNIPWPTKYKQLVPGQVELCGICLFVEICGGHSFDSIIIFLPKQNLVFAGENITNGKGSRRCVPHLSKFGRVEDMLGALDRLESFQAVGLIPAHGEPVEGEKACKDILDDNRFYLQRLLEERDKYDVRRFSLAEMISFCPPLKKHLLHPEEEYLPISYSFHVKNWEYSCSEKHRLSTIERLPWTIDTK